ncbi:MAG TPA: histidine kinase, partial [Methylibium sp.]
FSATAVSAYHAYGSWLVSISWKRFFVLSGLLMIMAAVLQDLPPFSWKFTETVDMVPSVSPPSPPSPPKPPSVKFGGKPMISTDKPTSGGDKGGVDITIDEKGVRIARRPKEGAAASGAASAAATAATPAASQASAAANDEGLQIHLPPEIANNPDVKDAIEEARKAVADAAADAENARRDAEDTRREAEDAKHEAEAIRIEAEKQASRALKRVHTWSVGDMLVNMAWVFILASAVIKITYKGQLQAEVKAAEATEVAESEALKRQVVEARMAAMQAQVEPHFLFNTLASIDHLIETDPARASKMQKNLIALLRASMPTMREANAQGTKDLGRELTVIRPYLEILKVRMEDRLQTEIAVPEGLLSAEFPPMMLQSLVENAIKHGLEPKPEGGRLTVRAEIQHGKLAVTVADTGLGFGQAATAGTGTGLANIRERLQLLYGAKAQLKIAENQPSGTAVTIVVPYTARQQEAEAA